MAHVREPAAEVRSRDCFPRVTLANEDKNSSLNDSINHLTFLQHLGLKFIRTGLFSLTKPARPACDRGSSGSKQALLSFHFGFLKNPQSMTSKTPFTAQAKTCPRKFVMGQHSMFDPSLPYPCTFPQHARCFLLTRERPDVLADGKLPSLLSNTPGALGLSSFRKDLKPHS